MQLGNDTSVMQVIRKFTAAIMALSLLLVSTVPAVSAASCAMPGMNAGMSESVQVEPVAALIDLQDCYIECGCRIDNHLDGMPHQLAPHALSMQGTAMAPDMSHVITMPVAGLTSRILPFSTPPPRTI